VPTSRESLTCPIPPRALSRVEAARYCGVGTTLFDRAVADGILPKPFRLYGRVLWCRLAIDEALNMLRDAQQGAAEQAAADSWADWQ